MAKLFFTQPEFSQKSLELPDGTFTVGRSRRNQIVIEDASVSKEHAELLVYGNEIIVRERGSQNGVFVSGVRIKAQSGVKHGERIRFGRVEVLLELGPPEFEGSTDITAMACLARMRETATVASRIPTQFPVRFSPEQSQEEPTNQGKATVTSLCAEPALPTSAAHSQTPPPSNSTGSLRVWVWLIIGVGALCLTLYGLLKR